VRLAYRFAMENDLVRADGIEATEFPDLANHYRVYAVPKTVINEDEALEGSLPEPFFLEQVLKAVAPPPEASPSPEVKP
jgi:Thioredoxin domain